MRKGTRLRRLWASFTKSAKLGAYGKILCACIAGHLAREVPQGPKGANDSSEVPRIWNSNSVEI